MGNDTCTLIDKQAYIAVYDGTCLHVEVTWVMIHARLSTKASMYHNIDACKMIKIISMNGGL